MEQVRKTSFRDLKEHIAVAIKESCYSSEVRLYNIANGVRNIETFSFVTGVDGTQGLMKIINQTVRDSVGVGCDLSVIVKGIFLGAFRASPFKQADAYKMIRMLIDEILRSVYKYNGNVKEAIEGLLSAIVFIALEYKLSAQDTLTAAKEDISLTAQALSPAFANDVKKFLPNLDEPK